MTENPGYPRTGDAPAAYQDRTPTGDRHYQNCGSTTCPCYVQGLAAAGCLDLSCDPDAAADELIVQLGTAAAALDWADRVHHSLLTGDVISPPESESARCGQDAGSRPYWMSPDQYDPCPCALESGHDGAHRCGVAAHND